MECCLRGRLLPRLTPPFPFHPPWSCRESETRRQNAEFLQSRLTPPPPPPREGDLFPARFSGPCRWGSSEEGIKEWEREREGGRETKVVDEMERCGEKRFKCTRGENFRNDDRRSNYVFWTSPRFKGFLQTRFEVKKKKGETENLYCTTSAKVFRF